MSVPEGAFHVELHWMGYDGILRDEVVVPVYIEGATTDGVTPLGAAAALFEEQGILDVSLPIAVRPRMWAYDEEGYSLGVSGGSFVDVVWDGEAATVIEPEIIEPSVGVAALLPPGTVVARRAVSSRQAEPLEPAVDFDNHDKALDREPAVVKNLDLHRPLVSFDTFLALRGDDYTVAEAEARYAELEAAHAARQAEYAALAAEVAP